MMDEIGVTIMVRVRRPDGDTRLTEESTLKQSAGPEIVAVADAISIATRKILDRFPVDVEGEVRS